MVSVGEDDSAARAAGQLVLPHKLAPGRLPVTVMRRARLWGALTDDRARVVLVCAPAGYGKSVLIADWVSTLERQEWAWLVLDAGDDDPVRFWTHLLHAVGRAGYPVVERVADAVKDADGDAHVCATLFAEELSASTSLRAVVLEDVHLATSPSVRAAISLLVELCPASLRIVIVSRSDPQLPVHRWRLRGEVRELREHDLRFVVEEARELVVEAHGVTLDRPDIERLVSLTEGWPAALQLAALFLRSESDLPALLGRSQRAHQPVMDFLSGEVLDGLPPELRTRMREAASVEPFCAELLDEVWASNEGSEVTRALRERNLFLVSLDEPYGWFRFHHLFGEYLRNELRYADRETERIVRSRAGQWCTRAGYPELAIEHFLAAGEFDGALAVLGPALFPFYEAGRLRTIDRWRTAFPDEYVANDPDRIVLFALVCLLTGLPTEADRLWDRLTASGRSPSAAAAWQAELVPLALNLLLGRLQAVIDGDASAVSPGAEWFPAVAARAQGVVARAHALLDDPDSARRVVAAMVRHPLADVWTTHLVAPGILSFVAFEEGLLQEAEDLATTARNHDVDAGREFHFDTLDYRVTLAGLALERESFGAASELAESVVRSARRLGLAPHLVIATQIAVAVELAADDIDTAQSELDEAQRYLRNIGNPPDLDRRLTETEVELALKHGDLDRAARLATGVRPIRRQHLQARVELARNEVDAIARHLADHPDDTWSLRNRLEHHLLLAAGARDDPAHAARHLDVALALAEPHRYRHSILSVDASIPDLLVSAIGRSHSGYAADLAGVRAPAVRSARTSDHLSLTPAEERVVYYLPSGLDTTELARHLGITKNTIKSHLKSIYRKLGVTTRADAIERARQLGLR